MSDQESPHKTNRIHDTTATRLSTDTTSSGGHTRRRVLGSFGVGSALALAFPGIGRVASADTASPPAFDPEERLQHTYELRQTVAERVLETPIPDHPTNDDEERYEDRIANFTKGLPHNELGEVDLTAYQELVAAVESGDPADFEAITLGGERQFIEPQAALGTTLAGFDPHAPSIEPPPRFDSAEQASEAAELYWMALARDVPFQEYDQTEVTQAAADDLSAFSECPGPTQNGEITTETLFRGNVPGATTGPYVSQFLLRPVPEGTLEKDQRTLTGEPGVDYLTEYDEWLANINGETFAPVDPDIPIEAEEGQTPIGDIQEFDDERRYIRTGRDLAAYVQRDVMYMPYINAFLILMGNPVDGILPDPGELYDAANPYIQYETQAEFVNFGRPGALDLIASVTQPAHSAAWFHKFAVHRRLRPEEFAGRVHNHLREGVDVTYPINEELFDSPVLDRINEEYGSYLLPQAYPEGAPLHPAYPGGHSTVGGACVTVLKAILDESAVIEEPVRATADGRDLEPWPGDEELTVEGELNKLAANISSGREFAGVHHRSNGPDGLALGEEIAIGWLRDQKLRYNEYPEDFEEWTFTTFDGEEVTV